MDHPSLTPAAEMSETGVVFDIQRFCLHDGPGIRTSVFLKGCPLRCAWCHNPESWNAEPETLVDEKKCLACRDCGQRPDSCPSGARVTVGRTMGVGEILDAVMQDRDFYEESGGGITLTGGEPAFQPGFSLALLRAAKARGLRTAVETCGFADFEVFRSWLPYTDLFLFDIKCAPADAVRLTGRSGEPILANCRALLNSGARLRLRVPLIRGLNISPALFSLVLELARQASGGVELLPGHNLGRSKQRLLRERA